MGRAREKDPVEELLDDVESLIDDWFQAKLPFSLQGGLRWTPATDVYETADQYRVTMAVPGLDPDDFNIRFEGDVLRVRGIRRERGCEQRRYHKMEIPVGPFGRRIRLPRPIRAADVEVNYRDGLLEIILPKAGMGSIEVPIE
ncbi:MAG TPA: Hsp20/alpha crystallin family protein [Gemmatimonadota bacterium]|nr:Hsp20/alpha crystallin family protein [Gemmatimonadota bacterium]